MPKEIKATLKTKRATSARWASLNPILADGELGYDKTNKMFKVGDGQTKWNTLPYFLINGNGINVSNGRINLNNHIYGLANSVVYNNFEYFTDEISLNFDCSEKGTIIINFEKSLGIEDFGISLTSNVLAWDRAMNELYQIKMIIQDIGVYLCLICADSSNKLVETKKLIVESGNLNNKTIKISFRSQSSELELVGQVFKFSSGLL